MSDLNLGAVYTRTAAGDAELASPSNGLSLNQRKLLQWTDGTLSVADLAERLAAGHTVESSQVARDMERLAKLGLLLTQGGPASSVGQPVMTAAVKSRRGFPVWLAVPAVLAVLAGAWAVLTPAAPPKQAANPQLAAATGNPQPELAPEESEEKIFGVMPNPGRWFSPGQKPEPKPETATAKPALPVAPAKPQPDNKVAEAKPQPAAAPTVVAKAAPAPAAPEPVVAKPEPTPVPQVASAAVPAKVEPNRKPIYREQPEFPRDATRNGIDSGLVRARMTVNEAGQVVKVDILEARPRRVFEKAVVAALSKWKFQQAGSTFTVDTDVEFKDN